MKKLLIAVLVLMCAPSIRAQTAIIVENPSFESGMSGWVVTRLRAYDGNYGNAEVRQYVGAPDGQYVAYIANASISQDLKITPQPGVYVMKFFVANWVYSYPNSYTASFTIGGKPICPLSNAFPLGDFTEITLVCTIPGYIAVDHNYGYSGNLGISFSTTGAWWGVMADKVSLTFTPTN